MNIKKMFTALSAMVVAVTMIPGLTALAATPDTELGQAYEWAYANGITTMDSYEAANMTAPISRAQMAKMLSVYATKILGMTPDTSKDCTFSDIASVQGDLHDYIIESCQLGLMGQGITAFRPYDLIPRSEFGTALSRTLWGETYNGGTPFYAKHLDALKEAKIMTKIANAENTNEIRGYVMIMLQRAAEAGIDCDDTDVVLACLDDINNCPAACKAAYDEEDNTDTEDGEVVKSGSLVVTADSADDAKVFIGRASDLDVLTFKTSEEVEISKVVLERYGYSTAKNVAYVWLENEDGKVITNKATVDSKGQAKLTLKKDYKKVDGELNATIVLETTAADDANNPTKPGATFWFKVVDVTSSAKNVDLDNYKPATYEAIAYDGSKLTLISRTYADKTYNYEADKLYEVLKFKVQTPDDVAIVLRGFTLNNEAGNLDLSKFFNEAEITVAGEKVSKLKAEANKSDELVFSFNDVEVPAKTKSEVVVRISLTDDFDEFWDNVQLVLTDITAVDGKVSARVRPEGIWATNWLITKYIFNGGKIKLTNNKLGNIDAAQNAEDVVIAEGTIEVPETIKGSFCIDVNGAAAGAIKDLTFVVNGDETDGVALSAEKWDNTKTYKTGDIVTDNNATPTKYYKAKKTNTNVAVDTADTWKYLWLIPGTTPNDADYTRYCFNNVEIDKWGKVKFLLDVKDANTWNKQTMNLSTFGFDSFSNLKYDDSGVTVKESEVSGTISFSKVTIQPSKASLKNNATKEVEFANKETNRKVVFDGTYTSKRGDIKLNEFRLDVARGSEYPSNVKVTFYLIVDGEEVADARAVTTATGYVAADTFDNVLVEDGQSVSVVVEAEVEANTSVSLPVDLGKYKLYIRGEDENGNTNSGKGDANAVSMKLVEKGSVTIPAITSAKTVLLKASDAVLAQFTVKPANNASEVDLESIKFKVTGITPSTDDAKVTLKVADIEEDDFGYAGGALTYTMNRKVGSEGVTVVVTIDDEVSGTVTLTDLYVNGNPFTSRTFEKKFANALVYVASQNGGNGTTKLTLGVDEYDSSYSVSRLRLYVGNQIIDSNGEVKDLANTKAKAKLVLNEASASAIAAWTEVTVNGILWTVDSDVTAGNTDVLVTEKFASTLSTAAAAAPSEGVDVIALWWKKIHTIQITNAWSANYTIAGDFSEGELVEVVENSDKVQMITAIEYVINTETPTSISKSTYNDYFKVGDDYAKIFKAS